MTSAPPQQAMKLTPSQSLLWIDGLIHPDAPINNMVTRLDIDQDLEVNAFSEAFAKLVQRHEAMRLTVSRKSEEFIGTISQAGQSQLEFIDYSGDSDGEGRLLALIQQRCSRVFGLNECLYEASLVKLGEDKFVFFMNQHHCVTDGRSCQIMLKDLDRLYHEQLESKAISESQDNDEPLSLSHYLRHQAQYFESPEAEPSAAFWAEHLKNTPEPMRLYGHSSDIKCLSTARHAQVLPESLAEKILAGKRETPPSMVFAAALFAFLHRASGNSDICIGVPLLNRSPEYASTLGLFMEVTRNRVFVSKDDSFASLLDKVRAEAASIKPHRSHTITSRNGRFEAMLNYRVPADTSFGGKPARLTRIPPVALLDTVPDDHPSSDWAGRDSLEVDITHTPASGEFYLALDFNTGVWTDQKSREYSLKQFVRLLEHFYESRDQAIDSLDIVSEDEKLLLEQWNDTTVGFEKDSSVSQLFEARAALTPSAIALEFDNSQFSYQDVNCRSNQLAHALIDEEIGPEQLVGICIPRSPELIVAILAVLKSGAAYVPLDPNHPEQRRQLVLDEAAVALLLTPEKVNDLIASEQRQNNPGRPNKSADLAYVIFTSGSTGRPKGVMIEHSALLNFLQAAQSVLRLDSDHRLLSVTTAGFDIFALEIFLPLVYGARMVLANNEEVLDGRLLADTIARKRISHLQATPATWHMLLAANWQPTEPIHALVGGELLTRDLAGQLAPRCATLRNWYGPTEATVWATQVLVDTEYSSGDVGRPLANYSAHILDGGDNHCPIGVTGELYIGGSSLARGYLKRDGLTAAAFREIGGLGRVYKTGDIARWTPPGQLEFLGRSDFQVKVRGFRIELGEIETALLSHPGVTEAVAVVFGDNENKRLAAYIKPDQSGEGYSGDDEMLKESLRSQLRQSLPHYMLPSSITALPQLPLTPNGKVDRKALPPPEDIAARPDDLYLAPQTPLQKTIAGIWSEALGLERVGIRDSFFDLGGHSLMAMRVLAKIEGATNIRLKLPEFLQGLTIEDICATASGTRVAETANVISALRSEGSRTPLFAIGSHPRYADAIQYVSPDQPVYRLDVYALQNERIDEGSRPLSSIEAIALELLEKIKVVQPEGPYYIGGGCEGSLIGFAVARELQRRGEEVRKLILWITPAPGYTRGSVLGIPASRRMIRHLKALYRNIRISDLQIPTLRLLLRHEYIEYGIFRAMDKYLPESPFQGDIILARTSESRGAWDTDPSLGWGRFCSAEVEVHKLPGNHDTWLTEHAEAFGNLLENCLP